VAMKMKLTYNIAFFLCLIILFIITQYFSSCKKEDTLSIKLEKKFSLEGDSKTYFYEPGGVAVDKNGNIYVSDSGNQRIVRFNSKGEFIKSFGRKGQGPGEFLSPWQIAIYDNELYVYDWGRNIQKFNVDGQYISGFTLRGGTFLDLDIDSKGNIYVGRWTSIKESYLIEKFDSNGTLIKRFCEPVEAPSRPLSLILNNTKLCIDNQDNIYVAFRYINKIQKYNAEGELIKEFKRKLTYTPIEPEHTPNDESPFKLDGVTGDIFCDGKGRLYITSNKIYDENGHLIDVLNTQGEYLGSFYSGFLGEGLSSSAELSRDQSIYLDNNNFYLIDYGSMNVHVFKLLFNGNK